MNTFEFARYLMNAVDTEISNLRAAKQEGSTVKILHFHGCIKTRVNTLRTACGNWVKFPQSLQLEARKLIRYANNVLDE